MGLFDVVDETKWDRLPPMSRTLQDKYRQIAETRSPLTRTAAKDPHQEQRGPPMWKQKACTARMTLLLAAYDFYTKADTASLQPMTSYSLVGLAKKDPWRNLMLSYQEWSAFPCAFSH